MTAAALHNATKRFGDTVAVADATLEVADGEFVVLLGPTGAGKTTTLRLFAGLETPEEGRVTIAGEDVTRLGPAERDVAFVFQQYSLYPHLTVYENLAFPLKAPGRASGGRRVSADAIRRRVTEIAELLRIESKLGNRVTALSGGEMQRVSIGRALVREPNLFLMDEPLSSLDAKLREDLRVELKRIQRDLGATILYVTHDQLEAMTLADRIGVLASGRLVQVDTPRAVYETPADVYAAQRLGSPQINLVPPGTLAIGGTPAGAATVGVRPEDVVLHKGAANGTGVTGQILTIEHFGVETIALVEIAGRHVHALVGPRADFAHGTAVAASVRPGAALYFDSAGVRLS
ncbi:ABC transporter ATP-binding protein [Acuticoccus sediminis]|uniref:ABC transporter ATP-binding protein n=1 Tax=Acuticoccus sediminis TaxID=2184697 RepID=UPI001CFD5AC2|nr:ABC transporter ATP-binding protein [Acuticoccus sediminis]